jgi:uncharacterized protein with HEPN domain
MRHPDDDALIVDMLLAAREIRELTEGLDYRGFSHNRVLQLALVKLVEVIGEAAPGISTERRAAIADVPWDSVIGMRHRLVHRYDDIDYLVVWNVARHHCLELIESLEKAVPEEH